jgi:FkbM family methyltransferase
VIPFNVLTPTRYGTMLCNQNDVFLGGSLLRYGEFSELEVAFLRPYLTPTAIVLDIGANIGALTIPFARSVQCVVAFEPQRLCYQTLCANVALNSLTNVIAFHLAVGQEHGATRVLLTDPYMRNNFGGLALDPEANGEGVEVVAIDDLGLPKATLVKIDVEGMEADVLRGARNYIAEHQPAIYLEADRQEKKADLMALIDDLGYNAFKHEPALYNPANFRGDPVNIFKGTDDQGRPANLASINLLCLPKGATPPEGLV